MSVLCGVDKINEWVGKIISYLVIFMMVILSAEVVLRYGFNRPTIWAHETSQFLFGAFFILGAGYTLLYRRHVNMDMLYVRLSLRTRAIVDLVTGVLFLSFCAVLLWKGGLMAWDSVKLREVTYSVFAPPIYPLKITLVVGFFLLTLQGLAKFIRDLVTAISGRELAAGLSANMKASDSK